MSIPELTKNFFEVFDLPVAFSVDAAGLGEHFRQLQQQFHPDRYAGHSESEQRMAVQYSALINQAYTTLKAPLPRALYLLELQGMSAEQVSSEKVDGGFLMEQMELREKLELIDDLVDPETVLDHLLEQIAHDLHNHEQEFAEAYSSSEFTAAAQACVKMQYIDKLRYEAEQIESSWID